MSVSNRPDYGVSARQNDGRNSGCVTQEIVAKSKAFRDSIVVNSKTCLSLHVLLSVTNNTTNEPVSELCQETAMPNAADCQQDVTVLNLYVIKRENASLINVDL